MAFAEWWFILWVVVVGGVYNLAGGGWWMVVGGGRYVLASGGWWWIVADIFCLVVGGDIV